MSPDPSTPFDVSDDAPATGRRFRYATIAAFSIGAVGAVPFLTSSPAHANYTPSIYCNALGTAGQGCIYSHDFFQNTAHSGSWNQSADWNHTVDWNTDLIWYNGADQYKVEHALTNYGYGSNRCCGHYGAMYNPNFSWDGEGGVKTVGQNTEHVVVYAPSAGYLTFSNGWGYTTFGTTHYDHNDMAPWDVLPQSYDRSDEVENDIAWDFNQLGYKINANASNMNNYQYGTDADSGNHTWQSDGYATTINVP
jgi:hypothetical protein